jgi:putative phage-type endonuclease
MKARRLADTRKMTREEWLAVRRQGIGGSDAGAVAGVSPWSNPVKVWLEKTGKLADAPASEAMEIGAEIEDFVAGMFSKRTGKKIQRVNSVLQSPDKPFMLANLDRLVKGEDAILECKNLNASQAKRFEEGGVPEHYQLQVQQYMEVTGLSKAYLAVLFGGQKFMYFEIERDNTIIQYLAKIEEDFWQYVVTNTPPPVDVDDLTYETVSLLHRNANENIISIPDANVPLIQRYEHVSDYIAELKKEQDNIKAQLCQQIGDNQGALCGGYQLTWKEVEKKEYVVKAQKYRKFNVKQLQIEEA